MAIITTDVTSSERDSTMEDFKHTKTRVLVTTNLLSRGIDITTVSLVINYDLPTLTEIEHIKPKPVDPETYLHRVGRTGRFGRHGICLNLITDESKLQQQQFLMEYY